ncbi:hypothetical protein COV82_01965 [Candidatus Peregrinibacteria bacterium CG11_big_fil_rev_8_21_14_0_20_46_8]|nr:MAG: hypothetical protein COV82_01965 [Candidatus Peregrinibacteria bacterium CG11_big_fil_rev_8_21_14_0_20_46_8]
MQRFFLEPQNSGSDTVSIDDRETIEQMRRVLRMQPGAKFIALDNSGDEFVCELQEIGKVAHAKIVERRKNTAEPDVELTLYQALPKKIALFEMVLQKATEIGVAKFVPLITRRTERGELPKRERMQKILKEAAEQSERGKIPELSEPVEFEDVIKKDSIILAERSQGERLERAASGTKIDLFVGPEGGFTQEELSLAQERGALFASLGPRILRTETAGIVASGILLL